MTVRVPTNQREADFLRRFVSTVHLPAAFVWRCELALAEWDGN